MDIELLRMAFERDDPFTMEAGECYFNTETCKVVWTVPGVSYVAPVGDEWVIVPATPHGEWHDVFEDWLKEIGKHGYYTTSIGLTLEKLDELDENLRYGWYNRKYEYSEMKAEQWINKYQKQ